MRFQILKDYALKDTFSDVQIESNIDGQKVLFFAHKIILSSNSDFLKSTFEQSKDIKIIPIEMPIQNAFSKCTQQHYETIIKFMYINQSLEALQDLGLTPENAYSLYSVSLCLQFENAKTIISGYIQNKIFVRENIIRSYLEAIKFENKNWYDYLGQRIVEEFGYFLKNQDIRKELVTIPLDQVLELLSKDDLKIDNEDDCLEFLIEYIQFRSQMEPLVKIGEVKQDDKKPVDDKAQTKNKNDLAQEKIKNFKLDDNDIN